MLKKTADFATQKDFPEANDILGAGDNPNTVDLAIFRGQDGAGFPVIISKMLLDDAMIETLIKERCLYLHYRSTTHPPVMVFVDSPFMSEQEQAEQLAADISTVTKRLRDVGDLAFISKKTTHAEAMQINMRHGRNMFEGCPYLTKRIADRLAKQLEE